MHLKILSKNLEMIVMVIYIINKIEKILIFMKDTIKQTFLNHEIFEIFKTQKRILLFLIEEKIIEINEEIANLMTKSRGNERYLYHIYFFKELKPFLSQTKIHNSRGKISQNSEELRNLGHNESEICEIIRKDSLVDFISHVKNTNLSLDSKVKVAFYETNKFLIKNNASLIEYAAFYGSIEIFNYLLNSKVVIRPIIYLFAIHGRNLELIHLLEENKIQTKNKSYDDCIKESIKCHHNEIANYFIGHLETEKDQNNKVNNKYCFHFHNFLFLNDDVTNDKTDIFNFACEYEHIKLVEITLKSKVVNILNPIILIHLFFKWRNFYSNFSNGIQKHQLFE